MGKDPASGMPGAPFGPALRRTRKAPTPANGSDRGYTGLFHREVLQADEGVDFGFLGPAKS